jgi:hypothetical protein
VVPGPIFTVSAAPLRRTFEAGEQVEIVAARGKGEVTRG